MPIILRWRKPLLFSLYFLFLWGGQLSSAAAAGEPHWLNGYVLILYSCFFSRALVWFLILREMELIKAYALSSLNFLIIPLLSFFLLGETLKPQHFGGAILIITGIMLFAAGEKRRVLA